MLLSWKQRLGTDHHKLELAHGVLLEAQYLFEVYITCQHFTVRFLASKTETVFLFFLQTDGLAVLDPHSPTWDTGETPAWALWAGEVAAPGECLRTVDHFCYGSLSLFPAFKGSDHCYVNEPLCMAPGLFTSLLQAY